MGSPPALIVIVASEQAILVLPVDNRLAHGMGHQHDADRLGVEGRIAAGVVVPLHAGEAHSVPGRGGGAVQLGEPQAQPAALERDTRKLPVKSLAPADERVGLTPAPARPVECNQRVEVCVQPIRIVGQPKMEPMVTGQPTLEVSEVLAEVPATRAQESFPVQTTKRKLRARLSAQHSEAC